MIQVITRNGPHSIRREKLPLMHAWLKTLEALGVRSVRLHLLEVDHADVRAAYAFGAQPDIASDCSAEEEWILQHDTETAA